MSDIRSCSSIVSFVPLKPNPSPAHPQPPFNFLPGQYDLLFFSYLTDSTWRFFFLTYMWSRDCMSVQCTLKCLHRCAGDDSVRLTPPIAPWNLQAACWLVRMRGSIVTFAPSGLWKCVFGPCPCYLRSSFSVVEMPELKTKRGRGKFFLSARCA